jgi:argininosuccinate lyase
MKSTIVKFSEIAEHPTHVMSARYWVNIKEGKLPFVKDTDGQFICAHTKQLKDAVYMTEEEAAEINVALTELKKAQQLVNDLLKPLK